MVLFPAPIHKQPRPFYCLYLLFTFSSSSPFLFAALSPTSSFQLPNSNMNDYAEDNPCCYFHPKQVIVGICAVCLKERLLNLASKQGHLPLPKDSKRSFILLRRKPTITLPKVFALGSLLHRLESRRQRPADENSDEGSLASLEDSFISIKFEDNGKASWDTKKKASIDDEPNSSVEERKGGRSLVEHVKPWGPLRWRKRIGHLLQVARWKRSSKAGACHVGLVGKVEGRRGNWIRSLTRRRTTTD